MCGVLHPPSAGRSCLAARPEPRSRWDFFERESDRLARATNRGLTPAMSASNVYPRPKNSDDLLVGRGPNVGNWVA
jgi:hypothetical protein